MTNFDRITESPEALAENRVAASFDENGCFVWVGIVGGKHKYFKNREEAVESTLKWLNEEVEE